MELPRAERCETCRFHDDRGYCHRFPPVRGGYGVGDVGDENGWARPITDPDDWCGEWQPAGGATHSPVKAAFAAAVNTLTDKSRDVLSLRFGIVSAVNPDGTVHSLADTAKKVGCTKEVARQVQERALAALRTNFPDLAIPATA